jgi:predicted O-methyltransferase YrrM
VPPDGSLQEALNAVAGVEGWLTDAQARRLFESARERGPGARAVEIGSYRGRSAIVLAHGLADGASFVAIDPHAGNDRGPQQLRGTAAEGEADNRAFRANLERAGVARRVRHLRLSSQDALGSVEGELDLVYVDGAHRYRRARDDLARWGARVRPGGKLLVHDSFSSIGVTLALARLLIPGREFRYEGRTGSLAEYTRMPIRRRARVANALRQAAELPWFARNLLVKAAILARLRPLARVLGHRSGPWPY